MRKQLTLEACTSKAIDADFNTTSVFFNSPESLAGSSTTLAAAAAAALHCQQPPLLLH
jgi:hypothetical protein